MPHDSFAALSHLPWAGPALVLVQVVLIDLVLAGDNALAVGLAASGLEPRLRRRVIAAGLGAAVVMRVAFALLAAVLLDIIGLLFAGGLLLLWVCWKMWRDLRAHARAGPDAPAPAKTFARAFLQIFISDLSMSLDNVLAVAGAAHGHLAILAFGLLFSIALMGVAANAIARMLEKVRWVGYVGVAIVLYVALHMTWEGYRGAVVDLHAVGPYNAWAPNWLDISPSEAAKRGK